MALDTDGDRPKYGAIYATPVRLRGEWSGAALRLTIDGVGHDVGVLMAGAVGRHYIAYRQIDTYARGIYVEVRGPGGAEACRRAVLERLAQAMRALEVVRTVALAPTGDVL